MKWKGWALSPNASFFAVVGVAVLVLVLVLVLAGTSPSSSSSSSSAAPPFAPFGGDALPAAEGGPRGGAPPAATDWRRSSGTCTDCRCSEGGW